MLNLLWKITEKKSIEFGIFNIIECSKTIIVRSNIKYDLIKVM